MESGCTCEQAVFVRLGMAAQKVLEAGMIDGGGGRSGNNTAEFGAVWKDGGETAEHAVRGLAHGKDTEVGKPA